MNCRLANLFISMTFWKELLDYRCMLPSHFLGETEDEMRVLRRSYPGRPSIALRENQVSRHMLPEEHNKQRGWTAVWSVAIAILYA